LLSTFEVTVGLTRRNGAILRELLDSIGKLIHVLKQNPGAIESLGFLRIACAWHMS
jgi:hypothetical protein